MLHLELEFTLYEKYAFFENIRYNFALQYIDEIEDNHLPAAYGLTQKEVNKINEEIKNEKKP